MLISCSYNNEVVSMNEVNGTWDKKKELLFTMNIEDTSTPKNIIFVVRNNNDYPYSNLFLITYLKAENEKNFKIDTLNYIMAKPNGEWLGKGFGETKEILFQYKNQYKFPKKGKYSKITPATSFPSRIHPNANASTGDHVPPVLSHTHCPT